MAKPQTAIFHDGHIHFYYLEFSAPENAQRKSLREAMRGLAKNGSDTETVVAFGPRAMRMLLPDHTPSDFADFQPIQGTDDFHAPATQRDVLVWIKGSRHDLCVERALEVGERLKDISEPALDLAGFCYRDSRDLIGFVDGSANPKGDAREAAAVVPSGPGAGGCYVLSQQWVHDLTKWRAVPEADQERIVGRTKPDSIELEGDAMPADSHVSRTDVKVDGEAMKIWRRSAPYATVREHGLYFLAFAKHPVRFQVQLDRMYGVSGDGLHDRLIEYSRAVTGSYWFAPSQEALDAAFG